MDFQEIKIEVNSFKICTHSHFAHLYNYVILSIMYTV